MSDEDNKILKYNHGEKSMRVWSFIYADLECLPETMHSCQNNLEKPCREKKNWVYAFWLFIVYKLFILWNKK